MLHPALLLDQLSKVGPHQKDIEKLFDGAMRWNGEDPIIPYPLVVLAFTNRSGSNLLAELLRSTGKFSGLGEALIADNVRIRAKNWDLRSFPDYFREMAARHKLPFGVKASWDQLLMLLRCNIPAMYTGLHVIHIHRYDVVSQGISLHIAWQTGKWTSLTPVHEAITPSYDARAITHQITATQLSEALFPLIFDAFSINAHHVSYEDLTAAPERAVRAAMEAIGYPVPNWKFVQPRLQKQANAMNHDFRSQFRELLRRRCLSGTNGAD